MLRFALLALSFAACGANTQHIRFKPLPELVATQPPTNELEFHDTVLIEGERMIWDIQAKGFSIARAEMMVAETGATSHVETNALASAIASLNHDLATVFDRETGLPTSASETLVIDSEQTKLDAAFTPADYSVDGRRIAMKNVHDIHTALGAIRSWVAPDAHAGFLSVLVGGTLYRIEVNQPLVAEVAGKSALRVDCRVLPPGHKASFTVAMWLAITSDHTPLRFEISTEKGRVAADLVERTESP